MPYETLVSINSSPENIADINNVFPDILKANESQNLLIDKEKLKNYTTDVCEKNSNLIGILQFRNVTYVVKSDKILVGRRGINNKIDIDIGYSNFVSRTHLEIYKDDKKFMIRCLGKNGIFIKDIYMSKENDPCELPLECNLHFPNTEIVIYFTSFICKDPNNIESNIKDFILSNHPGANSNHQNKDFIKNRKNESLNVTFSPSSLDKAALDREIQLQKRLNQTILGSNNNTLSNIEHLKIHLNYKSTKRKQIYLQNKKQLEDKAKYANLDNSLKKPAFSYAQLIVQALYQSSEGHLTLSGIYDALSDKYPYFKTAQEKGWQNSVRHNLSLNRYFVKIPRSHDESGKGSYWKLDVSQAPEPKTLIEQAFTEKKSPNVVMKNFSTKSHHNISQGGPNDNLITSTSVHEENGDYCQIPNLLISSSTSPRFSPSTLSSSSSLANNNDRNNTGIIAFDGGDGSMLKRRGRPRLNVGCLKDVHKRQRSGADNCLDKQNDTAPKAAFEDSYQTTSTNHFKTGLATGVEQTWSNDAISIGVREEEEDLDSDLDDATLMATSLFPETNPLKRAMIQMMSAKKMAITSRQI